MTLIDAEPIFLKIRGGWLNPAAILSVETHRQNEAMLMVRIVGLERPIVLNESDSAYISDYLASREWHSTHQEADSFVRDEVTA